MPNCFMIRSSPALAMLARLKWLMKHSAISNARMCQRIGVGLARTLGSVGVMRENDLRSSKSKAQSASETSSTKLQTAFRHRGIGDWSLVFPWSLEFGAWSPSSCRFGTQIIRLSINAVASASLNYRAHLQHQ